MEQTIEVIDNNKKGEEREIGKPKKESRRDGTGI